MSQLLEQKISAAEIRAATSKQKVSYIQHRVSEILNLCDQNQRLIRGNDRKCGSVTTQHHRRSHKVAR
jgi:hypothetical protein